MKNSILSAKTLYHISNNKHNGLAISEPFQIGHKTKFCTLLFVYIQSGNVLAPMSLQIDQSQSYGIIPDAKSQEPVVSVEEIDNPPKSNNFENILVPAIN